MSAAGLTPQWAAPASVCAAFSLRRGGVSRGEFATLNVGLHVGDVADDVQRNRALLGATLALPGPVRWLQQVHGNRACVFGDDDAAAQPPQADAAVTRVPGVVLAVMVADCLPVLLADRRGSVVGVAHAGWRGLAAGVLEATVQAMRVAGSSLVAWLGPCIRQPHFEVGAEVRAAFVSAAAQAEGAFQANSRGRWQCDLPLLARQRLAGAGVSEVADCGRCTFAEPADFYSHRRDRQTGRMAALLWLRPP